VYTRKSTEEGLEMEFNSLDAQREACEAYVASQRAEGWLLVQDRYDDGGFSGGNLERPALKRLLGDIEAGRVDVVVVYKIDRLSRSLMDFSRLVEVFDRHNVTFVSVAESEAKRPPIPTEGGHRFRSKAATQSERRRPPC
jgi:DNA invertase Pin-like site-specific DNA recombinase